MIIQISPRAAAADSVRLIREGFHILSVGSAAENRLWTLVFDDPAAAEEFTTVYTALRAATPDEEFDFEELATKHGSYVCYEFTCDNGLVEFLRASHELVAGALPATPSPKLRGLGTNPDWRRGPPKGWRFRPNN